MDLNLVLHPAPPSVWQSAKLGIQVLVVTIALAVFGALASALGYDHLSSFGHPRSLAAFVAVGFALVPIPYALEFLRNRSWSRVFSSTAGKVQVQQRTLTLELELTSRGDPIDEGSATVEVLLRWRTGILRWSALSVSLADVVAVAQPAEGDGKSWKLTGSLTLTPPIPDALRLIPTACEVGVELKVGGSTRTRVLEGRDARAKSRV